MKKIRIKNTKQMSFELVKDILKYSPEWDSMSLKVIVGKQDENTYLTIK